MQKKNRLSTRELRCSCDPSSFGFKTTAELDPLDEVIGQKRAVQAIDFGLNMDSPGYNIFVSGFEGTGKTTIIKDIVRKHAEALPTSQDWCMVNNFKDTFRPLSICSSAGTAVQFSRSMRRLIKDLRIRLPKQFENKNFQEKLSEVQLQAEQKKQNILDTLNKIAGAKGFHVSKTSVGYQPIPLIDSRPMTPEAYQALPEEERARIEQDARDLRSAIESAQLEINKVNAGTGRITEKLVQELALFVVKGRIDLIRSEYRKFGAISDYLDEVQENIVDEVEAFIAPQRQTTESSEEMPVELLRNAFDKYTVNVLVDRKTEKGAPVIFEPNPTYANVFGQIEKKSVMGALITDFSMVKAGSLLQANGGYLIMEIESVLMNPQVWEAMKRALQNKQLYIEDAAAGFGLATASLRPEPIPLEVKVILLGSYTTFQLLQNHDSKFNKIFKVRADFDYETQINDKNIQLYARFISRVCKENDLLPFSPEGVASIVEFSGKFVSDKNKLSLRFGPIVGIVKEANYWARKAGSECITEQYVIKAFNEHRFRYNLHEEKVHESYVDETILINVASEEVGQVNALAVYQMGDISFGRPSRITAETYMGKSGIINIEREAELSGSTHDKGVLIFSGYLGRTFAQKFPLNLSISITFEQNYGGIDGDSASSTELYAILSSLSDIPIHQGLAVTGSINQKGEIQAIGGVNHKIEGYFDVCKAKGLTGRQGVLIPVANVKNLMLKLEVIQAVKKGKFHIYKVSDVKEGIEILTGVPAGEPDDNGDFPDGTVYGKVQKKLEKYLAQSLKFRNHRSDPIA